MIKKSNADAMRKFRKLSEPSKKIQIGDFDDDDDDADVSIVKDDHENNNNK